MIHQTNYSEYTSFAQNYCIKNIRNNYASTYFQASTRCFFTEGEGWFDNNIITDETSQTKTINLPQIYSTTSNASIEIAVVGTPANQPTSIVPHHIKVDFLGSLQIDQTYSGYQFIRETKYIPFLY